MTPQARPTRSAFRRPWLTALGILMVAVLGAVGVANLRPSRAEATTLLSSSVTPSVVAATDAGPVTVGVIFTVRRAGSVAALRFYKGAGNDGTHTGGLFDESGKQLAKATFQSETATGWQRATLDQPLTVAANSRLVAAVLMPKGHYAFDHQYSWPQPTQDLAAEQGRYRYGDSLQLPDQVYLGSNYWVDVEFTSSGTSPAGGTTSAAGGGSSVVPSGSASPSTSVSPTRSPSSQPSTGSGSDSSSTPPASTPPSSSCVGPKDQPGGADPWGGCWPGPQNTGYPHGLPGDTRTPVALTPYTGPNAIRSCGVVIDSKIVTNDLIIQAGNGTTSKSTPCVTIRNSLVKGVIYSEEGGFGPTVVSDTEVFPQGLSYWENVGRTNMFVTRVNSHGSEGVIKCEQNCEAVDSWVHGMRLGGSYHYNAFGGNGMSSGSFLIRHNWASCGDWEALESDVTNDAGCSAAIGFYGDFDPIKNITIERNFLIGSSSSGNKISTDEDRQAGYCLNPGYYPSKPFPRPTNVKVVDNVFGRGSSGKCGVFGPANALNGEGDSAGNTWEQNRFADGTAIPRPEE